MTHGIVQMLSLALVCISIISARGVNTTSDSAPNDMVVGYGEPQWIAQQFQFGQIIDLVAVTTFLSAQVFPASLSALFPTLPFLRLNPSPVFYKLDVCARDKIVQCMQYGAYVMS